MITKEEYEKTMKQPAFIYSVESMGKLESAVMNVFVVAKETNIPLLILSGILSQATHQSNELYYQQQVAAAMVGMEQQSKENPNGGH